MSKTVLIATQVHSVLLDQLTQMGYNCHVDTEMTYERAISEIHQFVGIITSNKLPIDKGLLQQASQLLWIGRMGSGMEIIDTLEAQRRGIACFSSPEGNANAVAEQALGMLLALQHHIVRSYLELRSNIWEREGNRGIEIEGLTAGIIGLGNNGLAFAKKLQALGMKVIAYDKYLSGAAQQGVELLDSWHKLVPQCDVLSFHVPLNDETRYYFGKEMLSLVTKPLVLLNLSRGPIVDLHVLLEGMDSGIVKAAALDVWEYEPISKMPPDLKPIVDRILSMPNFIGTPHIGGYSEQATYKMSYFLAKKIADYMVGK